MYTFFEEHAKLYQNIVLLLISAELLMRNIVKFIFNLKELFNYKPT